MELFKKGDFILNKNAYKGEPEKLIVDIKDNYYMCVHMKGKHTTKPNFNVKEGIHTEYTDCYKKVG